MKRILFVTSSCFPVRGAECIVNARLLSVLSKSGRFKIDLVTKKSKWQNYPSDSLEQYGIQLESLDMIEVDNTINIKTIWQHFLAYLKFGIVNKGDHWALKALPTIKKLINNNNYDYILTRAQPSHLIGNYVKKKYGVKWVCTWNDPYPTEMYPTPYGKGNNELVASKYSKTINLMQNADVFIYPNKRLADYMNKFIKASDDRIKVVPHVMMDSPQQTTKKKGEKLSFIHSGDCTGGRSAHLFLLALKEMISHGSVNGEDFLVCFMGKLNEEDRHLVKDPMLKDVVVFQEPVSYLKSLAILKDYDIALIIEAPWDEGVFLPTKVSDFMMAGKRIFTISPQNGLLHDLYIQGFIPYYANVMDYKSIKKELERIVQDSRRGDFNSFNIKVPEEYTKEYVLNAYLSI